MGSLPDSGHNDTNLRDMAANRKMELYLHFSDAVLYSCGIRRLLLCRWKNFLSVLIHTEDRAGGEGGWFGWWKSNISVTETNSGCGGSR